MTNRPFKPTHTIRLGAISFVNTVPIYANYSPDSDIELIYEVPARLNALMLAGELDLSPVSSACYLRNQDTLVLLEDLSVSSPGAVESVLFLSRKPLGPDMLDAPVINVPNDSETSVMLLAHLLQDATGQDLRPWFRVYEAADYRKTLRESGNALIIGDNALMMKEGLPQEDQPYYCYDLSTLWKEKTGLPFVFAVWVANRQWAERHPEQLQTVNRSLCQVRDEFFTSPVAFEAGMVKAQTRSGLPEDTLERYYRQCLTYGLSAEHYASLNRFEAILKSSDQSGVQPVER